MSLDSQPLTDDYVRLFYKGLDCPRSLACWLLYSNGEHQQLVDLEVNPDDYITMADFRDSLAATSLLSKSEFLQLGIDRKAVALEKFSRAEAVCAISNRRIFSSQFKTSETSTIIMMAARKIESILGRFDADEFVDCSGWGPGATSRIRRTEAFPHKKFESATRITRDAYDFVTDIFNAAYPTWEATIEIDIGAKIVTVPKNAKTDRTIAIEPGLNLWFQKGIGQMIRRRLLRVGLDLNSQRHNQRLARLASLTGDLATIDFSAASDTISRAVVRELLPERWYTILDLFRSKVAILPDGEPLLLQKFSSMGNGFTFELETLIFYAVALAVREYLGIGGAVSVYGDDVIIPTGSVTLFTDVCSDLGFTVNKTKSFSTSYFRESCGSYYYYGKSVKPIFLKRKLSNEQEICKSANSLRRYAHSRVGFGCDRAFRFLFEKLSGTLGKGFPRISDGFGDVGLISNIDEPNVSYSVSKHGIEGFYVRIYAPVAHQLTFDTPGILLERLRQIRGCPEHFGIYAPENIDDWLEYQSAALADGLTTLGYGNNVPSRKRFRISRKRVLFPRWISLGDWV